MWRRILVHINSLNAATNAARCATVKTVRVKQGDRWAEHVGGIKRSIDADNKESFQP